MKVKVGDRVYSTDDELVMVILDEKDKENILNMPPEYTKYCAGPDGVPEDVVDRFMEIPEDYVRKMVDEHNNSFTTRRLAELTREKV